MRKIILVLMLVVPLALMAQKGNFTITGKVGNLNAPAKVYLVAPLSNHKLDSAAIVNGQFELKGTIDEPVEGFLGIITDGSSLSKGVPDVLQIFLAPETITVNSSDSVKNAKVTGSQLYSDYEKFQLALKPTMLKQNAIMAEYKAMTDENKKDPASMANMTKKMTALTAERKQIIYGFISSNPGSYLSLYLLKYYYAGGSPNYSEISPIYNSLSDAVKQSIGGKSYKTFLERTNSKEYADSLEKAKGIPVGTLAWDFTQNDVNGKPVKLSDFKGKYLLVDFWASWCGPCRGENPNVVKAYSKYHDKGLEILGVSLDTDKAAWLKAISDDNLNWKHVSDLKGWKNEVGVLYRIKSIPSNLLIDPSGKVIAKDIRGEFLNTKLAELMK